MRKLLIILISILYLSNIQAQESRNLSLQEAFNLAIQNSKQLKLDSLKKESLDIRKEQTKGAMVPLVGVSASYTRLSNNIDPFAVTIPGVGGFEINTNIPNQFNNRATVQQPIFQGLKNWNTLKALDQQKLAADFDIQKDKDDVKLMIVQAYYNLYKLQQTNALLDSNIAQTQVRVDDLTRLKNVGIILNNDVMRAQLQKTNLLVNKADVESGIQTANFNLNILLGLDGTTKFAVEDPTAVTNPADETQSLIASAFSARPELKAQDYRSKAADYQIKASKSAYMPTVNAVGNGYYSNPNARVFPPEAKFKATWDVGVSVSWNIMQLYTARAVVNDAKNQKAQLQLATAQIKDAISSDVNANIQALKVAQLKIDLAQQAIDQATENRRILNNRFNSQIALLSDVLEGDVLLLQAQANLLNAKADVAIASYKLQRSLGTIK